VLTLPPSLPNSSDWWNSISFDEFSRKWNRPVHTFLLRHVYATTISSYKFSKFSAAFVTFLLSALVHELVMAVVTKKVRMYLFVLQVRCPFLSLHRSFPFSFPPHHLLSNDLTIPSPARDSQMAQLPLIMLGRARIFKRHPALGNRSSPFPFLPSPLLSSC
jgi:sterol O-acyltransferase